MSFVIFASILFPIPLTILAVGCGFGNVGSFDGLFQMLICYAEPIMLPCVLVIVAYHQYPKLAVIMTANKKFTHFT